MRHHQTFCLDKKYPSPADDGDQCPLHCRMLTKSSLKATNLHIFYENLHIAYYEPLDSDSAVLLRVLWGLVETTNPLREHQDFEAEVWRRSIEIAKEFGLNVSESK